MNSHMTTEDKSTHASDIVQNVYSNNQLKMLLLNYLSNLW